MIRATVRGATLAVWLVASVLCASAQPSDASVAAHALGGAVSARSGAFMRWNPATIPTARVALAHCRVASGGLAGLVDGASYAGAAIDSITTLAAGVAGLGYGPYAMIDVFVSAGRRLTTSVSVGASIRCEMQAIAGYGVSTALLLDAGMRATLLPSLSMGVVARNVTRSTLRGIARPQQLGIGFVTALDDATTLSVDAVHDIGRGISIAAGAEASVNSELQIRVGVATAAPMLACGIGYDDGPLLIDAAVSWSPVGGASYMAGAGWRW